MRVVLTGATGNLGSHVGADLVAHDHQVIPVVRSASGRERLSWLFPQRTVPASLRAMVGDLRSDGVIPLPDAADAVVHCAGSIHFHERGWPNTAMTKRALRLAEALRVPFYHISTAFVGQLALAQKFRNTYEADKTEAEAIVQRARVPWAILRPSVITGHSTTGCISHFSGYYHVVNAFRHAAIGAGGRSLRFPKFMGETNIIPVDTVAHGIVSAVERNLRGTVFLTHPRPPDSHWLISTSLEVLGLRPQVTFLDLNVAEFGQLPLQDHERQLLAYLENFSSYWTGPHRFPTPAGWDAPNEITSKYIATILTYAESRNWC